MTRLSYCRFVQAQLPKQTPGCLEEAGAHVAEMLILQRIEDQLASDTQTTQKTGRGLWKPILDLGNLHSVV
jgi:hypothetical protein